MEHKNQFHLSQDDVVVLLVGVKLLREMVESIEINDISQDERIEELIENLDEALPEDFKDMADEIVQDILYAGLVENADAESGYNLPMYAIEETMPILEHAITDRQSVDIEYYSMSREEVNQRKLNPFGIRKIGTFFWLAAYCHWRKEIRLFRVDRIKSIKPTTEPFEVPNGFSLEDLFGKGKK